MAFGWTDEPLYAEQKLHNLFYTIDNTLETLQKAYKVGNRLKSSRIDTLAFHPAHGYRAVMRYEPEDLHPAVDRSKRQGSPALEPGYWMVYAERIGSLGDDRHKWPVWDTYQAYLEPLPKGMLTRELPRDYLSEKLPVWTSPIGYQDGPPPEDYLIVATIEKNKWRPGPHNAAVLDALFGKKK